MIKLCFVTNLSLLASLASLAAKSPFKAVLLKRGFDRLIPLSHTAKIYEFFFFFSFTGKNYAAATAKTSAKSKLATTLVAFGTQGCVCADVHWRHCNNVPPITFSTSPTAASKK